MWKVLKRLGILFGVLFLVLFLYGWWVHEPKPVGEASPDADVLAQKMITAVNKEAWDTTAIVQWNFLDRHQFLWDKERNFCRVRWGNNEVLLNLDELTGRAWSDGEELSATAAKKKVDQAWFFFANDSFWFNAVVKAFDPGTKRSIVQLEDGREGLMVHYSSGGVTPGDSYVWLLDEKGLPKAWKFWVKVIPIGGLEFAWEDWVVLSTGARVATTRRSGPYSMKITDVKGAASLKAFGLGEDPFLPIE